jgi:hypothetical protein
MIVKGLGHVFQKGWLVGITSVRFWSSLLSIVEKSGFESIM